MANCANCSSFDPYYKSGWCDANNEETSPSNWCPKCDCRGSHEEFDSNKVCSTCDSFDPYTRGGYCNYHRCTTNRNSYCSDYS